MSRLSENSYGFVWDNIEVTRAASEKGKWKVLMIKTPLREIQVYVTETGLISVNGKRISK